jgi:hypothetical protein
MRFSRLAVLVAILATSLALFATSKAEAQGQRGGAPDVERACPTVREFAEFHRCAQDKIAAFEPPRTPDGKPNFNGIWQPTRFAQDIEQILRGQYRGGVSDPPVVSNHSIIVDPVDGRIPYQAWAATIRTANEKDFISPTAACIPVGVQRWSYSPVSVTGQRIVQRTNEIVTSMERLHTYRIIPIGGGPRRLASNVKMWRGESRARWEGNTLVIETTNNTDKVWFDHIGTFVSPDITLTERLSYVDANTLHYQETINDPRVFTQPWTIALAFLRSTIEGMDRMDLEDTTVEFCDSEIAHFFNVGQKLYRGFPAAAEPK